MGNGDRCLVTAVTSRVQAVAAAEAGASYVAPYVGRVSDWHKANSSSGDVDMGIQLVWDIQRCYHSRGYKTKVRETRSPVVLNQVIYYKDVYVMGLASLSTCISYNFNAVCAGCAGYGSQLPQYSAASRFGRL